MVNWEDPEYVNPYKKIFKNLDTGEILNLEIQEDSENIIKQSKTPMRADNLNKMQTDALDDMSKTYTGTNIVANTVEGCGRINRVYGTEEGIGTDVNLFNEQNYSSIVNANVDATGLIITSEATEFEIIYIPVKSDTVYTISSNKVKNFVIFTTNTIPAVGVQGTARIVIDTQKYTLTTGNDTKYICLRNVKTSGNVQNYLNIELKVQEGSVATPYSTYRKRDGRDN